MKNSPVDESIISATKDLKNEIVKLKKENIPFVFLDGLIPLVDANYVILDNYNGVVHLTKHLITMAIQKMDSLPLTAKCSCSFHETQKFYFKTSLGLGGLLPVVNSLKALDVNLGRYLSTDIKIGEVTPHTS